MAAGRVCTGFSLPYVATYSATGGTVTYSSGQKLARGVNVSITPESGDDNNFYADNVLAESANTTFTGGEVTLTVDGLLEAAEKLIMGLPTSSGGWMTYNDDQAVPYVGIANAGIEARSKTIEDKSVLSSHDKSPRFNGSAVCSSFFFFGISA